MDPVARNSLSETCTKLLAPLENVTLKLRVADVRQPKDCDPVISWSLNGKSIEMPAPVSRGIGRIDTFVPDTDLATLKKGGVRIGSIALVQFAAIRVSVSEKEGKEDPLTGARVGGGIYADANGDLHAYRILVAARTGLEMQAAGAALVEPASA
jgi:hypothetical protein